MASAAASVFNKRQVVGGAPSSEVLFGSDFRYPPAAERAEALRGRGFPAADLRAIERDNALRIMPGLLGPPGISL